MKKSSASRRMNRRDFVKATALFGGLPLLIPSSVLGYNGSVSPGNRLNAMIIGMGNRGSELLGGFVYNPHFQVLGVCDCYKLHADRAKERTDRIYDNEDCKTFARYEEVLDADGVDVAVIATPDHWHTKIAVEACKAGKDVYCEKPLTLTLAEGRQIVAAARKYNRVCTGGSQRVMEDYGYMAPIMQSGAIGDVKEVFVGVGGPPIRCYLPEEAVPEGMDWDRWQGQAPVAPFNADRCSGNYGGGWRRFTEYCNGFLADWGAHKFAGAMYILGLDDTGPVAIYPKSEDNPYLYAEFANGVKMHHAQNHDITFIGTEGKYEHEKSKLKPLVPVEVRQYSGGTKTIIDDFAFCVRNRLRPFQDFEYAARSAALCQLMVIGYLLNRPLKWDPVKTEFIDDPIAQRFVSRAQRAPYEINV